MTESDGRRMTEIGHGPSEKISERRRILIVDDEPEIREMFAELLGGHGFEILQAANGLEALLQVKRMRPHGITLDLAMPRLGGLEALKRIRTFDPAIRVVVVTADLDPRVHEQALALGAAAVLTKPVDLTALLAAFGVIEPPPPAPDTARAERPGAAVPGPLPRVLVVDDDAGIRELLAEALGPPRFAVQTAANAAAALRDIVQVTPDVVLLDIDMPGLSGVEALPSIRALAPDAMIIMVSGTTDVEVARRALAHGAFDYVTKPIDLEYLTRSLETAIAMKRSL